MTWPACPGEVMHTGTHREGPGGKLQVGWQLDVAAQQCEQAQQEVHDLKGQEGHQVLLPILEGRFILSGPWRANTPRCCPVPMQPVPSLAFTSVTRSVTSPAWIHTPSCDSHSGHQERGIMVSQKTPRNQLHTQGPVIVF